MNITQEILIGLIPNFLASFLAIAFAFFVRDGIYNRRRYEGWEVKLTYHDQDVMPRRAISWRKAKEIAEEPAELSVFLKGVASPYARIHCDIISEGKKEGLLTIDPSKKPIFGERRVYTINLSAGEEKGLLRIEDSARRLISEPPAAPAQPPAASQPAVVAPPQEKP
jgi:hypothetical protein